MSRYYKGAGIGTFWHKNDAMVHGFTAASAGSSAGVHTIKNHIVNQLVTHSPYISLTRSYEVAEAYAKYYGRVPPESSNPAYVYELNIEQSSGTVLFDPVQELSTFLGSPFNQQFYQHNGAQDVILGVVDSTKFAHVLSRFIRTPGIPPMRGPSISDELITLIRALRDAEVLALGVITRNCLIDRHDVA